MWQMLALALRDLEDLAPAVEAIERAAALAPRDPLIAHTRARTALEAGLPSAHLFESAAQLAPQDAGLLLVRPPPSSQKGDWTMRPCWSRKG